MEEKSEILKEVKDEKALVNPCRLCQKAEATRKNSHIIPSFLCARVLSYDGSGSRDKDVTFTITESSQTVHVGKIPSTKYEELFDMEALSEERIQQLKPNPMSDDYYLCTDCEDAFSHFLETPYSAALQKGKAIDGGIGLFFWISVFWRISITRHFGDWFDQPVNEVLGKSLNAYIEGKLNNKVVSETVEQCPVIYKVLYNPDYLKDDAGFFFFRTNASRSSAILLCGDLAVWLGVKPDENIDFFGLQGEFKDAPVNNGIDSEKLKLVPMEWFVEAKNSLISILKDQKIGNEQTFLNQLWQMMGMGEKMPIFMQKEIIASAHGEGLKLGDRGDYRMWAPIIQRVTSKYLFGGYNND